MTFRELPRIRIGDPGELIDTVPYLLGFHPRESLVLVGFAGTGDGAERYQQVKVTIRADLPDELPGSLDADALQPLCNVLREADAEAMAAVLVTESVPGDPRKSGALLACRDVLATLIDKAGIEILDVLVTTERRWWSLCCEQPECCPAAGHERTLGCSAAAARATFAGLVALPDRDAMVATLAGRSAEHRSALQPYLADAQRRRDATPPERVSDRRRADVAELLATAAQVAAMAERAGDHALASDAPVPATGLSAEQLADCAVALTDRLVRDAVWLALDDGCQPVSQLMAQVHAEVPAPYDAAPVFLFGWSQWRAGNATLAMMAAERALVSRPGYPAAMLLLAAAQRGLDPRSVPALSRGRRG